MKELLISVKVSCLRPERFEYIQRSLNSLLKNTVTPADIVLFGDFPPQSVIELAKSLNLPMNNSLAREGDDKTTQRILEYVIAQPSYSYFYHADEDFIYAKDWDDPLVRVLRADPSIGAISAFTHPGADRYAKYTIDGVECLHTMSTSGGSAMFNVKNLREVIARLKAAGTFHRLFVGHWDYRFTLEVDKLYKVISVKDSRCQHIGRIGSHGFIEGLRFIGEG